MPVRRCPAALPIGTRTVRSLWRFLLAAVCGVWSVQAQVGTRLDEILVNDPRLDVMSTAMVAAASGFHPLDSPPYTIIAPTNDAFNAAIRQGSVMCGAERRCQSVLDMLQSPELQKLVFRHVFNGRISPNDFKDGVAIEAINGAQVKIEKEDGWDLRIGGARLTAMNAYHQADDGVIFVIDSVMLDYSRLNISAMGISEIVMDVGPYDNEQRAVLVEEVSENINCYRKIRALDLPDGAIEDQSALMFNPVPPYARQPFQKLFEKPHRSIKDPQKKKKKKTTESDNPWMVTWRIPKKVKRPVDDESLAFMTVAELAALLRQKDVTSMELTKLYLGRLKRYDEFLEVVVTVTEEKALAQARRADKEIKQGIFRSPLHGIPYGLKDLISVPDYPTTWGAAPYENQTFERPAWCYEQLERAGAVLVAKLATGAMAWGDVWFNGRTRNPWNIAEGSCGSSSGSGAATVAALVPFAVGTETWGSMSCPAETMGVTGFRPTFGMVGRTGVMTLASSLDKIGVFCREAFDCGMIMDLMRGQDPLDPNSVDVPLGDPQVVNVTMLKIGYTDEADQEVVRQFSKLGVKLVPVKLNFTAPPEAIMNIILGSEAGAHFDQWLRTDKSAYMREQHKWPSYIRSSRFIPAVEYVQANRARGRLMKEVYDLIDGLDGVLVPARGRGSQGAMGNVLGLPQIVFPTGHDDLKGNPDSPRKDPKAQAIFGLPLEDAKVLALGQAFQKATPHHLKRPPIDKVEENALSVCLPFSRCALGGGDAQEEGEPTIKVTWARIGGSD